jgi:mRNA interferase MazF
VKRGEIWTVSGGSDFAGKPRPAVIVRDDNFAAMASVSICAFTSDPTDAPLFRIAVAPSRQNGLKAESRLMADKLTTVSRGKLGKKIGELAAADMKRLERAVMVFLGLAR